MIEDRLEPKAARQLRGLILTMVYVNHNRQRTRLTSTVIGGTLHSEGYQFSRQDILTMIQDMRERGYLRFQSMRDDDSHLFIFEIELTSAGRDLVDGLRTDPAVQTQ